MKRGVRLVYLAAIGGRTCRMLFEFPNQRVLHSEDDVTVQVLVAFSKDVSDQFSEPWGFDHEVNMGGSPGMASLSRQHFAHRAVVRNGIGRWADGPAAETAVLVGAKAAP